MERRTLAKVRKHKYRILEKMNAILINYDVINGFFELNSRL